MASLLTLGLGCIALLLAAAASHLLSGSGPSSFQHPLLLAAFEGDLPRVLFMIAEQRNASREVHDAWNNTAMHWAVKDAHPDTLAIVDALMAAGADPLAVNAAGSSVLHWSVHSDDCAIVRGVAVRMCSAASAEPHSASSGADCPSSLLLRLNERNESALHWAVDWQRAESLRCLLQLLPAPPASAVLVNQPDVNGDTPLHRLPIDCVRSAVCRAMVRLLLRHGASVTAENHAKRRPLQHFDTAAAAQEEEKADDSDGGLQAEPVQQTLDEQAEQFRHNLTHDFRTV